MIHFFRKIRKALLSDNKFTKYLIYAIGEIALVMIGILLALQANNWNEARKEKKVEHSYLVALNEEFLGNLKEVERVISLNKAIMKKTIELAQHTGPAQPSISDKELGKLFFETINNEVQYRSGTGVVNEIISSGGLGIFRNADLKNALAAFDSKLLNIRYQENEELGEVRKNLISLLQNSNFSSRKMVYDADLASFGVDGGKFTQSNLPFLQLVPFDNLLTQLIYTSGYMDLRYLGLKAELERILTIIQNQLNT